MRNQKGRETSIKDAGNHSKEEGSVLDRFGKYREAQRKLKSKDHIDECGVSLFLNIKHTNLQHS